jgi:hypothetical protein
MTQTIHEAELGWVLAGLRLLKDTILHHSFDPDVREIASYGRGTLPTSDEIEALCERLNRCGLAVQMPDHEWLQTACRLLKDDEPAAALSVIEQIIKRTEGKA